MSSIRSAARLACAFAAVATLAFPVAAAPPVQVTSQAAVDGPIRYTVKVISKQFGNAQETRTIRSGETDDFTWKTVPPGGPVPATDQCPDYASWPADSNGATIRQTQLRVGPVVASDGVATVQLSFMAQTPQGTKTVDVAGKSIRCTKVVMFSQVIRFTMPTDGSVKSVALSDGTQLTLSAQR